MFYLQYLCLFLIDDSTSLSVPDKALAVLSGWTDDNFLCSSIISMCQGVKHIIKFSTPPLLLCATTATPLEFYGILHDERGKTHA